MAAKKKAAAKKPMDKQYEDRRDLFLRYLCESHGSAEEVANGAFHLARDYKKGGHHTAGEISALTGIIAVGQQQAIEIAYYEAGGDMADLGITEEHVQQIVGLREAKEAVKDGDQ